MIEYAGGGAYKYINSFGGTIDILVVDRVYEDNQAFVLSVTNIPDDACIELSSQDWTSSNVSALGVLVPNEGYKEYISKSPLSVDEAINYCQKAQNMSIRLYFDIDTNSDYWKNKLTSF